MMNYAPVVVFAYNRPVHVQGTLEALMANELATQTDLIVYSDGPGKPEAATEVQAVRAYLQTLRGFRSITIRSREKNWGLAASIVDGVTTVINDCGRVIILEDDILTSPHFLRYMNEALDRYADEARVMHIAGHMLDIAPEGLPETFFLRQSSCWGWGTWARAWQHFQSDPKKLLETFSLADIHRFNLDGAYNYWAQVEGNAQGSLKTWAVFWYAAVFQRRGLCLHPRRSLVRNIGFDGTGTNCGEDFKDGTGKFLSETGVREFPTVLEENRLAFERYRGQLLGKTDEPQQTNPPGKWSIARQKIAAFMGIMKKWGE